MDKTRATINDLKLELWLRRRNSDKIFWKTKCGDEISIRNMSDSHLENCINVLMEYDEDNDHTDCAPEIEDAGDRI